MESQSITQRVMTTVAFNREHVVTKLMTYQYDALGRRFILLPTGGEGGRRPDEGASAI